MAAARRSQAVLPRLIARTSNLKEQLLLGLAALFAAANGIGFPLLPVLFARSVAQFSALYNPDLQTGPPPTDAEAAAITRDIQKISSWMLLFGAAAAISTFIMAYVQIKTARIIVARIRRRYFAALMRQDATWYNRNKVGDLSTRVTSVDDIERALGETAIDLVRDIFAVVMGFVLAFTNSWKMTLVIFAFMPVIAIVGVVVSVMTNRETRACQSALGQASATAHETFSLIRAVLAFEGQDTEVARYGDALDDLYRRQVRRAASAAFGTGFLMLVLMCTFCVGFFFGNRLVRSGEVTLARAIAASAVVPSVFAAFRLANEQKCLAAAAAAAQSVFEVMNRQPAIDSLDENGVVLDDFQGGITFENVQFQYEGEGEQDEANLVLDNFNLDLKPGTSHGLCGPSGCGKSTVVNLIERFYDVTTGRILLDGKVDIREVNVRWLRTQIGLVGQTPTLFQGTVRENIELGVASELVEDESTGSKVYKRRNVSMEEVVEAAKIANAHDFTLLLPDGYDTQLGEGGALLSGGQKQRVCIARAIIRNPKILLLDESTASLDNKNESVVQEALERAAHKRTTLIVAHRTGTIRRCDTISVLKDGNLSESDTHDNLMGIENGAYATMVRLQNTTQQTQQSQRNGHGPAHSDSNALSTSDDEKADGGAHTAPPGEATEVQLPNEEDVLSPRAPVEKGLTHRVWSLHKKENAFTAVGVFGSAVVGAAWPLAAATICELLLIPHDGNQVASTRLWSLLLFGCGLGAFFGILVQNIFLAVSGERLTRRARERSFMAMLSQDMSFFDLKENGVGSLVVKLNSQIALLKELTCDTLGSVTVAFVSVITGVTIATYYCWRVALSALAFMPGILLSGYSIFRVGLDYSNADVIESVRIAAEALHCIRTVSSFGMEYDFMERYDKLISAQASRRFFDVMLPAIMSAYIAASPYCLFGTAFWTGSIYLRNGNCDLLGVNKATLCLFLGSVLVGELSHVVPNRSRAKLAASEYFRLMRLELEALRIRTGTNGECNRLLGMVDLADVKFAYPNRPDVQVLRGLTAGVGVGKTLALVGSSGSGKSTVISLIQRFYGNRQGSILADGQDVCEFEMRDFRSQVSLVHQEPGIFNRSIRENIAYGLPHIDGTPIVDSIIHEAAKVADAHDFIMSLPEGYNTIAGASGDRLSGGQKQRIAIARAVVRKPAVLLLDEATSALDSNTEQTVQRALDAAAFERTTIVVAHRLATIRNADCIAVVNDGLIVEQGTHDELLQAGGAFAELSKAQR